MSITKINNYLTNILYFRESFYNFFSISVGYRHRFQAFLVEVNEIAVGFIAYQLDIVGVNDICAVTAHERRACDGVFNILDFVTQYERTDAVFIIVKHIDVVALCLDIVDVFKFYREFQGSGIVVEVDDVGVCHGLFAINGFLCVLYACIVGLYHFSGYFQYPLGIKKRETQVGDDKRKSKCNKSDQNAFAYDKSTGVPGYIHDSQ